LEIKFGGENPATPKPIHWERFRDIYLEKELLSILPAEGVLGEKQSPSQGKQWVMHPETAQWEIASLLPITQVNQNNGNHLPFGIAPMGIKAKDIISKMGIEIWRDGTQFTQWTLEPQYANGPAALWGEDFAPRWDAPTLVKGLVTGYRIIPTPAPTAEWQTLSTPETHGGAKEIRISPRTGHPSAKPKNKEEENTFLTQFQAIYG
jgi:hypothetical protein